MVNRFMCIKVLHDDGEHTSPTHVRVVAAIDYDALLEAVRKVTCWRCSGDGDCCGYSDHGRNDCPDCADLRALLGEKP